MLMNRPVRAPGGNWFQWLFVRSLGLKLKHDWPWKAVVGRMRLSSETASRFFRKKDHQPLSLLKEYT